MKTYVCVVCGHIYEEAAGDPAHGIEYASFEIDQGTDDVEGENLEAIIGHFHLLFCWSGVALGFDDRRSFPRFLLRLGHDDGVFGMKGDGEFTADRR